MTKQRNIARPIITFIQDQLFCCFDGFFYQVLRALLDLKAKTLTEDMLVAVAHAIAGLVDEAHLSEQYIFPRVSDPRILPAVVKTIKESIKVHI